jgi:hypothetical protein
MHEERDNFKEKSPIFSVTDKLTRKLQSELNPAFSISPALFCRSFKSIFSHNPFSFYCLRTLSDNYQGWGYRLKYQARLGLSQNESRNRKEG